LRRQKHLKCMPLKTVLKYQEKKVAYKEDKLTNVQT
jgi:hypothetical protein